MKKTIAIALICIVAMASVFATAGVTVKVGASPFMFAPNGPIWDFEENRVTVPSTMDLQYALTDNLKIGASILSGYYFGSGLLPTTEFATVYDLYCASVEYKIPFFDWFAATGKLAVGFGTLKLMVNALGVTLSLGTEFSVTDSIAVVLDYNVTFATGFMEDTLLLVHYPQLGVSYSF